MKNMIKRIMAAAVSGAIVFCAAGCEDKNNSSGESASVVTEEEMPYGATVTKLLPSANENVKVAVEYDNRFLTEEEAILVSDYIAALNNVDAELMEQTVYLPYLEDILAYNGISDTETYLSSMHDNIENSYAEGGEFEFDYVVIESCLDETSDESLTGFSTIDSAIKTLSGEDVAITLRKRVGLEILFTINGEGSYSLKNRQGSSSSLYIYEIDGQLYII